MTNEGNRLSSLPPEAASHCAEGARHCAKGASRLLHLVLGIDGNYTRGDKALAWSVFLWSFGWSFCLCFLGNVVWHAVSPQPPSWWGRYFFLTNIVVPCIVGAVSTVWFGVCSTRDLLQLFRDLEARERSGGGADATDDGRVGRAERDARGTR